MAPAKPSAAALPLILNIEDFKGDFSFDALFGGLVNELLPSFQDDDADGADSTGAPDALQNGTLRGPQGPGIPMFPAVEELLALFKDSCKELVDLRQQIDGRLQNLKKDVEVQDAKHRKTLAE
ncbi:exocyst complex component SEC10a-like, partial [Curcuma longa]